jgi:IMP dehydrogenase
MSTNSHVQSFMQRFAFEGLTFDDVTLMTQYADFLPDQSDISTRFTSRTRMNMPFVSAAMDTVTESGMAVAMALLGGIGVIHKNLNVQDQVKHVAAVKHYLHGLIRDPVVFRSTDTLDTVDKTRSDKGYSFSGFPILDDRDRLVGILTSTDIKYTRDRHARVADVMTRELITAPPDTDLQSAYDLMMRHKIGKLPLLDHDRLVGLYSFSDVRALVENAHPQYNRDAKHRLRVAAAVSANDQERVERLVDADVDVVVVDSAHGHSKGILDMVRWIKAHCADLDVVAGNVGTGEGAVAIRDAGADAVKVGIGPGSICTTRVVCGVGVPQITAVYEASKALEGSIPVIADGGIRHSGDVPKAIVAGADAVMLGAALAGTEESPGEKIIHQGRQYVVYRGMGSLAALKRGRGSRERYMQADAEDEELVPQGIEGIVPYAGTVQQVMNQFCGGLRSALGYCGSRSIAELKQRGRFVRVSMAGFAEGHPHDVKIMKEAPNYRM